MFDVANYSTWMPHYVELEVKMFNVQYSTLNIQGISCKNLIVIEH